MGKAFLIVSGCSTTILATFALMLFLMSTINPPPIDFPPETTTIVTGTENGDNNSTKTNGTGRRSGTDDVENAGYGVHNVTDMNGEPIHNPPTRSTIMDQSTSFLVNVYPPILPPVLIVSPEPETRIITVQKTVVDKNKTENGSNDTEGNSSLTIPLPLQVHRRSVDTRYIGRDSRPVVLKILDDFGDPRIEIKLEPTFKRKRNRDYRSSLKKASADFENDINDDLLLFNSTEILVMPNYTVVVHSDNVSEPFIESHLLQQFNKSLAESSDLFLLNTLFHNASDMEGDKTKDDFFTNFDKNATFDNNNYLKTENNSILALQVKIDNETKIITERIPFATNLATPETAFSDFNYTELLSIHNLTSF